MNSGKARLVCADVYAAAFSYHYELPPMKSTTLLLAALSAVFVVGCGHPTPQEKSTAVVPEDQPLPSRSVQEVLGLAMEKAPQDTEDARDAEDRPIDYEKYLPDSALNKEVAGLLKQLDSAEGFAWGIAYEKLKKLFPAAVEPLLVLAENPDPEVRLLPILSLDDGDLGPHKQCVEEFLRRARGDREPAIRSAALSVTFRRALPEATTELLQQSFAKDEPEVRGEVMNIVGRDKAPDRERLLLLVQGLRDKEDDVIVDAIDALDDLGIRAKPVVAELRGVLESENKYVRGAVIEALAVCGPTPADMETIAAACDPKDVLISYRAAKALWHLDLSDPKVVDMALKAFDGMEDSEVRCQAAKVLAHVWPVQERIVMRLAKAIQDPDLPGEAEFQGSVRDGRAKSACLWAPRFIGKDAAGAIPNILSAPLRNDFMRGSEYLDALRCIAPKHPEVVAHYKAKFANGEFGMFDGDYLGSLGDDAGQFAEVLVDLLASAEKKRHFHFRRDDLLQTVPRISGVSVDRLLPVLLRELDSDDENIRGYAYRAIGSLGARAAPAVPAVVKEFARKDHSINFARVTAIGALGKIGPSARESLPQLRTYFRDPETYRTKSNSVWHTAVVALARIDGQNCKEVLDTLRDEMQCGDEERSIRAIQCAREIGPAAAPLCDDLRKLAADRKHELFGLAVTALIRIGGQSSGADVALEDLESPDEDRQVQGCEIAAFIDEPGQVARVLPVLRRLQRSRDAHISGHAAGAIRAIAKEDAISWEGAIPRLGPQ